MNTHIPKFRAHSYGMLACVLITALVGCPIPGPGIDTRPDPRDSTPPTLSPNPVVVNGVRSLVTGADGIDSNVESFVIVFAEAIRPVSGEITLSESTEEPPGASGAQDSTDTQTFNVQEPTEVQIEGANLTLLGVEMLEDDTVYEILIPMGVIADTAGNPIAETTISFTTEDLTRPFALNRFRVNSTRTIVEVAFNESVTVSNSSLFTLNAATSLPNGANLVEAINKVNDQFDPLADPRGQERVEFLDLRNFIDSTEPIQVMSVESSTTNANVLVMTLATALEEGAEYILSIGNAAVSDEVNLNSLPHWRFILVDTIRPTLPGINSRSSNTFVVNKDNNEIAIRFNEEVNIENASGIRLEFEVEDHGDDTLESVSGIRVAEHDTDEQVLVITLNRPLHNGDYTLTIDPDSISDNFANTNSEIELFFSIDGEYPVLSDDPLSIQAISDSTLIDIEFNEDIFVLDESRITLEINGSGTWSDTSSLIDSAHALQVAGENGEISNNVLRLSTTRSLSEGASYRLIIYSSAYGFGTETGDIPIVTTDQIGYVPTRTLSDTPSQTVELSFTVDTIAPELVATNPVSINEDLNEIEIEFTKNISIVNDTLITLIDNQFGTTAFGVTTSAEGNTVVLEANPPLNGSYSVAIGIGAVADAAGNTNNIASWHPLILPAISVRANSNITELYIDLVYAISEIDGSGISLEDAQGNTIFGTSIRTTNIPPPEGVRQDPNVELFESVIIMEIPTTSIDNRFNSRRVTTIAPGEYTLNFAPGSVELTQAVILKSLGSDMIFTSAHELITDDLPISEFKFTLNASNIDRAAVTLVDPLTPNHFGGDSITINSAKDRIEIEFFDSLPDLDDLIFELREGDETSATNDSTIVEGTSVLAHNNIALMYTSALTDGAEYTLFIEPSDNNYIDSEIRRTFTVPSIAPALVNIPNPVIVNNAPIRTPTIGLNTRALISIAFTENISIVNAAGFTIEESGTPGTSLITGSSTRVYTFGSIAHMTHTSQLASGNYILKIAGAAVSDGVNANNAIEHPFTVTTTGPTLADDPITTVSVEIPDPNDMTSTIPATRIFVNFSENIILLADAAISLLNAEDRTPVTTTFTVVEAGSASNLGEGSTLILQFASPLPEGRYVLRVNANAVSDSPNSGETAVNNALLEYTFSTTPPATAPRIRATNYVEIGGSSIFIKFNEDISIADPSRITLVGTFTDSNGTPDISLNGNATNIRASGSDLELRLNPTIVSAAGGLAGNYLLNIGKGAVRNSNSILGPVTSENSNAAEVRTFSITDDTRPTLINITNTRSGSNFIFTLTFSEPIELSDNPSFRILKRADPVIFFERSHTITELIGGATNNQLILTIINGASITPTFGNYNIISSENSIRDRATIPNRASALFGYNYYIFYNR